MTNLMRWLKSLLSATQPTTDDDEAYLAEAVDCCDLERRMRNVEEQRRTAQSGLSLGLYPR